MLFTNFKTEYGYLQLLTFVQTILGLSRHISAVNIPPKC